MNNGIVAELDELIRLKQYVQFKNAYNQPCGSAGPGQTDKRLLGRGMDFAEVRNYQAGDEIRHMDWRVTARTGRPYIKLYQEERERPVMLACDFSPSLFFGTKIALKSVIAAQLAALIAWTVVQRNDRIGAVLHDGKSYQDWLPRGRQSGVLPILSGLSQATYRYHLHEGSSGSSLLKTTGQQHNDTPRLSELLARIRRRLRPGTLIVIISDFYTMDELAEKQIARLAQQYSLLAYSLWDPFELNPPLPGRYPITNGQTFMTIDWTCPELRARYQRYCSERISDLETVFKRLELQDASVVTGTHLPSLVQATFARRYYGR